MADKDNITMFHETGLWLDTRTIYLHTEDGEINDETTEKLIKNVHVLEASTAPINIILNSVGGGELAGYAIYDYIVNCDCHVTITCVGECSSAATIILQAADVRRAYRNTYFLLHDGSTEISGNLRDVERRAEAEKGWRTKYYRLLEQRTHQDAKWWTRNLSHDLVLDANRAKELGLIDEVI